MNWRRYGPVILASGIFTTVVLLFFRNEHSLPLQPMKGDVEPRASVGLFPDVPQITSRTGVREIVDNAPATELHLRGWVRSGGGSPVPGAELRWIALKQEDTEADPSWRSIDWAWIDRQSATTRSSEDGSFEFDSPPTSDLKHGSVLIAVHPNHEANGLDLPTAESWRVPVELLLEPDESISVLVVDERRQPVAAAIVRHMACVEQPRTNEDFTRARHRRFLTESVTSGSDGVANLTPFRGEEVIWAEVDGLISVPWQGENPRSIELVLERSFTLGGTLAMPAWDVAYRGERRILVTGLAGNLWKPIARLRAVENGTWGPLCVPLGFPRCRVRLEGAPLVPQLVEFDAPPAGAHKNIDLLAEVGFDLWIDVKGADNDPIVAAQAELVWLDEASPSGQNQSWFGAGPDGSIHAWGLPQSTVNFLVSAPGYSAYESYVALPANGRVSVTLSKGGSIMGRCLSAGGPVTDFQVFYLREGAIQIQHHKTFFGREEGRFELDSLDPGTWLLSVVSPHCSGSKPVAVKVGTEPAHVDLELPTSLRGFGQVLDANTREPVPSAEIQVITVDIGPQVPWGRPFPVESDGSFDLDVFVPGRNLINVLANGYARREGVATGVKDSPLDWGELLLYRPQPLKLKLLAADQLEGVAKADLVAFSKGTDPLPQRHFVDDQVVFEAVAPGERQLIVALSNAAYVCLNLELTPGENWDFDCSLAGPRSLDVIVDPGEGVALDYYPLVHVFATEETGFVFRSSLTDDENVARFRGIRSSRVQINVSNFESQIVATTEVDFGPELHLETVLRFGEKPFRVHVVDRQGAPVAGAWVRVRANDGTHIYGIDDTDGDGWSSHLGLPKTTVLLDVEHTTVGKRYGLPIDASAEEAKIVLEAKGSIELHLVDGATPLAGVLTWLESTDGAPLTGQSTTDANGRVTFTALGEGHFRFACQRAGVWSTSVEVALAQDETAKRDVQLRRLGNVELTGVDAEGKPLSGIAVSVRSVEFDADVSDWIATERVHAPGGLRTDGAGKLQLEGLPHGKYSWTISLDSDLHASGAFEVAPGETRSVALQVIDKN